MYLVCESLEIAVKSQSFNLGKGPSFNYLLFSTEDIMLQTLI